MATLAVNQSVAPQNLGDVDLAVSTVGYQAFISSLAAGHKVQQATDAANNAVVAIYNPNNYQQRQQLPLVVYKVVGNANLCPVGCR